MNRHVSAQPSRRARTALVRWLQFFVMVWSVIAAPLSVFSPAAAAGSPPTSLLDPNSVKWASLRGYSSADFAAYFNGQDGTKMMMTDIDGYRLDGATRYSAIWQANVDGRGWYERRDLTSDEFHSWWTTYKEAGYRLIDQEVYNVGGSLRWAGIWIQNKENLGWASHRGLSNDEFAAKYAAYKEDNLMPVDVEAYLDGGVLRYSGIWVKNSANIQWIIRRNLTAAVYAAEFTSNSDAGYRVVDLESYRAGGVQYYAVIWQKNTNGRGWYAYRDMSARGYKNRWNELRDAGYRLIDFEAYDTEEGLRYAGVWRQNTGRPNWALKDEVDAALEAFVASSNAPGVSVAIARNGSFLYMRGDGFADIDAGKWANSRTVFRLASVAKPVGATLAMKVDEESSFDVSDRTDEWFTDLPNQHTHTVAQLLSHRSGVRHYISNDPTGNPGVQFANAQDAAELFMDDALIGPVGGQYSYSTHAYTLVGAALEEATGKDIGQLFRDEITTPYGLSSLRPEDLSWNNPERARIYSWDGSENDELAFDNVSWKVLGGGLESSVYDLTRFGMRLVDEGIVSQTGMDTLFTRPDALRNYGLGWATGTESGELRVNHNGSWTGASSFIQLYPDQDIVIVVLGNARGLDVTTLGMTIGTLVLDETLAVAAAGAEDAMTGEFQPSDDFAVDATTGVIIGPVTPIVPVLPLLGAVAKLSLEPDFDAPANDDPMLPANLALPLLVPTLAQLNLEAISVSLAPAPDQSIVPAAPLFKIFLPTVVK